MQVLFLRSVMSIWVKQGNFTVSKSPEQSSYQLQNRAESLTISGLIFINNSAWMYIGQSTVQPSAAQLDGMCNTLADLKVDRCNFPERKKKIEMGRREQVLVQKHKTSTVLRSLRVLFYFPQQCAISAPPRCSFTGIAGTYYVCKTCVLPTLSSLVRNKSSCQWHAHSGGYRDLPTTTALCWLHHFSCNLSSGYVHVARKVSLETLPPIHMY